MVYDFNPYAILGVSRNASPADIQRAFDRLALRLQPDRNPSPAAAQQFHLIRDAHALLSDNVSRTDIDRVFNEEQPIQFELIVMSSKRTVRVMPEDQVIYLLAEIHSRSQQSTESTKADGNLNLTLVIDQSTSMRDERRMEKVRAAAQTVISNLNDQDTISVVAFNDRAEVIIPATRATRKSELRVQLGKLYPSGSTEMYKGLNEGVKQTQTFLDPKRINHILLLTDGHTYTDEAKCLDLAGKAATQGISISAMGLGSDWNDTFLDQLASITGGTSTYIDSVNMVTRFLDEHVRHLTDVFAERMQLIVAPDPDVKLEMAFKILPNAQPLPHENGVIPLGSLMSKRPLRVLIQLQLPANMKPERRSLVRLQASGDIISDTVRTHHATQDMEVDVAVQPPVDEGPPVDIVDALAKLSLYRLQERAQTAMARGDYQEATQALEKLSTRLLERGETELAKQAKSEAQAVARTRAFSNEQMKKTIKYQTRALIESEGLHDG